MRNRDDADDGHGEVDGGDLRQAPGPLEGAHHGEQHGGQEEDDQDHPLAVEGQALLELHGGGLLLQVVLAHDAVLGVLLDLDAVAQQEEQGDNVEHHQAHGAEADAGVHGQAHQGLGHAGGIGVDHAAGEAHGAGEHDDGGAHHLVIPQGDEQGDDDGIEGIEGVQIADDAQAGEQGEEHHHHDDGLAVGLLDHGLDAGGESAGHVDDLDAAADEQHGADDAGALHDALVEGGEELQEGPPGSGQCR